jgi:hypothetical protein
MSKQDTSVKAVIVVILVPFAKLSNLILFSKEDKVF